jgi:hypothetical protein
MTTAIIERDLRPAVVAVPLVAARAVTWMAMGMARGVLGIFGGRAARVRARCCFAWGHGLASGLVGHTYAEYLEER